MLQLDQLPFTPDDDANRLLGRDPLALLIGMLLDQQFPMERAFYSPWLLAQRLGGRLDVTAIAEADPDVLKAAFQGPPALHRYPGSMAERTQELCRQIIEVHGGRPEAVWEGAASGEELYARVRALPGFGEAKARIFLTLLGRRFGVCPPGWEAQAATWASIADVESYDDIARIREAKREMKAAAKQQTAAKGSAKEAAGRR